MIYEFAGGDTPLFPDPPLIEVTATRGTRERGGRSRDGTSRPASPAERERGRGGPWMMPQPEERLPFERSLYRRLEGIHAQDGSGFPPLFNRTLPLPLRYHEDPADRADRVPTLSTAARRPHAARKRAHTAPELRLESRSECSAFALSFVHRVGLSGRPTLPSAARESPCSSTDASGMAVRRCDPFAHLPAARTGRPTFARNVDGIAERARAFVPPAGGCSDSGTPDQQRPVSRAPATRRRPHDGLRQPRDVAIRQPVVKGSGQCVRR